MTRIALLDGPLDGPESPARTHAKAMETAIRANCAGAEVTAIAVFENGGLSTTLARVVEALEEAVGGRFDIVHCSLGLARPDPALGRAIDALLAEGAQIVAACPARGGPVWPAAHPGVWAVQGDARCAPGGHSHLGGGRWFGACPRLADVPPVAGASVAAAHFSGLLAAALRGGVSPPDLVRQMPERARWHGREHRLGAVTSSDGRELAPAG